MKRKLLALAALAALLLCAPGGPALAAAPTPVPHETMITDLKFAFAEQLLFMTVDGKSMDIDFGEQTIPTGNTIIAAAAGDHILMVADRRKPAGNCTVSASIGPFTGTTAEDEPTSFVGTLRLHSPAPAVFTGTDQSVRSGTEMTPNTITDDDGQYIAVGPAAGEIMRASTGSTQMADFSLTFSAANTRILISAEEAVKVRPTAYSATVTWTLTTGTP